jgi:type II secretory ATPase GspE/PulE/Tfp pilus assembly ATPase PilB-like protein
VTDTVRRDERPALPLPDLRTAAAGELALRLSPRYLDEHCLLPLGIDRDGTLITAIGRQVDPTVTDELTRLFRRPLRLVQYPAAEIQAAVLAARRTDSEPVAADVDAASAASEVPLDDLRALATQAPVIKLVNVLILDALKASASDIHLESTGDGMRVRYRLDGVLTDVSRPPQQYAQAMVSRVKIMAGLDVAERRVPQDGRIRLTLAERSVDLRVSTVPALHGESVVLRILDHGAAARDLGDLGMPDAIQARFARLVARTNGIVLVTGPTGSGKTTTLYAALARVNSPGVKVVTVEDPVEYQMDGVTQIPVNRKAGVGFASALRSILRHDPDVIMVGEMRDRETAEIAIQAALTGHRVFSTLHTNDAVSGVTRLVDMGIEPYLVAATVSGIVAQRLVRVTCEDCGNRESGMGNRSHPGQSDSHLPAGRGRPPIPDSRCLGCSGTRYHGRTGIYELFTVDEEIRRLIADRATLDTLRAAARSRGMTTLREDGMAKVAAGVTTTEEVLRVTSAEEPA